VPDRDLALEAGELLNHERRKASGHMPFKQTVIRPGRRVQVFVSHYGADIVGASLPRGDVVSVDPLIIDYEVTEGKRRLVCRNGHAQGGGYYSGIVESDDWREK
jgi:hypothetical protein